MKILNKKALTYLSFKDLKALTSTLYRIFSNKFPLTDFIDGCCPCCAPTREELSRLLKPLETLSIDDFGRYPGKALSTWGDVKDFKYFLPRMLEINVYFDKYDSHWLLSKLELAELTVWPDIEKNAFLQFCVHYFYHFLEIFMFDMADEWGCFLLALQEKFDINFSFDIAFISSVLRNFLDNNSPNKETGSSLGYFFSVVSRLIDIKEVTKIFNLFQKKDLSFFVFFLQDCSFYPVSYPGLITEHNLSWVINYRQMLEDSFFTETDKNYVDLISKSENMLFNLIKVFQETKRCLVK